jgi:hypothetical protein
MGTRLLSLTTSYSASTTLPSDTRYIEVWGVDSAPATAHVDIWLELTAASADYTSAVETKIPAGSTYSRDIKPGQAIAYRIKATSGTPKACIVTS